MPVMTPDLYNYLKFLVEKLPEIYQPVEVFDKVQFPGKRDCADRWEVIKGKIKPDSVVLDLGSSTGYFTRKIAKEFPSTLVVSMECGEAEAAVQKEILRAEGLFNVVLLNHRLTVEDMRKWGNCVEGIDTLLALSVFHHFPAEAVLDILQVFSRMIPEVLAEVPTPLEADACGQATVSVLDPFEQVLQSYYPVIAPLVSSRSHLGDFKREVVQGSKVVSRGGLLAYWDCPNTIKRHTISKVGGEWKVDKKDKYVSGVNIWSLLHMNPIWPEPEWWQAEARRAFSDVRAAHDYISDIRPWNMLMTAKGLTFFDVTDKFPKGDQAEFRLTDIDKLVKVFIEMKPLEWKEL